MIDTGAASHPREPWGCVSFTNSQQGPRFVVVLPGGALQYVVHFQLQLRLQSPTSKQCPNWFCFSPVGFLTWHAQEVLSEPVLKKKTS